MKRFKQVQMICLFDFQKKNSRLNEEKKNATKKTKENTANNRD